jgi:transposase
MRQQGFSYSETAAFLGVGYATVNRIIRLHRETASVAPRRPGGGNRSQLHGSLAKLLVAIVHELPDATVSELTDALLSRSPLRGAPSARAARLLAKKKSFVAVERDTPECRRRRRSFCAFLARTNAHRLVFIDESFVKTGMRREYAWSPRGERAIGSRPFRTWRTVSLVGAIRLGERPRLMTHRGTINGRTFLRFVNDRLVPWLRPDDVVVVDNLNIHKMAAVRRAIYAAGASMIYLPTYSPDLNPIELLWADLKRSIRKIAPDNENGLRGAVRRLRASLPISKIEGWFRHCAPQVQCN